MEGSSFPPSLYGGATEHDSGRPTWHRGVELCGSGNGSMVQRRLGLQPHTQQLAATLLAARGRIAAATYRVMLTIPDTARWLLLVLYNGLRDASPVTKLTLRSLGRGILAPHTPKTIS